jgi:tRNA pseudouridine32 synthase/23S rRNA pseudouridine746 synthase
MIFMDKLIIKRTIRSNAEGTAADFLVSETGLSKSKIKDAMNKGALWIKKKKGGARRLRGATALIKPGDSIEFHYDEKLLSIKPPEATCLIDQRHYSAWFKPAGLMAQGTMYGDHCSLMRQVELQYGSSREVYLVHRLDREASGVMLIAHSRKAAAKLSELFQANHIVKKYRVQVLGDLTGKGMEGTIDRLLDGKSAITEYKVESYDPASNTSTADVSIRTGRLHQIRRHFEMIGFPVIGDPKYGTGNKNREGMKLVAYSLQFICPFIHEEVRFECQG